MKFTENEENNNIIDKDLTPKKFIEYLPNGTTGQRI